MVPRNGICTVRFKSNLESYNMKAEDIVINSTKGGRKTSKFTEKNLPDGGYVRKYNVFQHVQTLANLSGHWITFGTYCLPGTIIYFDSDSKFHRDDNKPAILRSNGAREWWVHGYWKKTIHKDGHLEHRTHPDET